MNYTKRQVTEGIKRLNVIRDLMIGLSKDIVGSGIDYNKEVMFLIDKEYNEFSHTYFNSYKDLKKKQVDTIKYLNKLKGNK